MKRALLILVALLSVSLSAQDKLRTRWSCKGSECASVSAGAVSFTTPTQSQAFQTSVSPLTIGGTARFDVTRVDWSNDRGGNGTALGTTSWSVSGGGIPEAVFEDTFTISVSTNLVDHTPGPTGVGWTEVENTSGTNYAKINVAGDYVGPQLTESSQKLIVIATPAVAVSGSHYTFSAKTGPNYSVSSGTDSALIFGYQDTSNYCALVVRSSVQNPDLYIMKRVAGVNTDLGSANVGVLAGTTLAVEVSGATLTAFVNGASTISAFDGFCDTTTTVGLGWGDIRIAGRTINQVATFDDVTVIDEDAAASGVTLQSGTNIISATAYCGVSICGTDTLTVSFGVSDTTDPQVTITGPTSSATYATSSSAIAVSGTASDNIGVSAVTWACATCTPTSGSATGTTAWTFNATLASGANTIIVTSADAAGNDATDQVIASYTPSDVIDPTVAITGPTSGPTHTASATPLTVSGTASDNVAVTAVICTNSLGGANVLATGTTAWSCPVQLFNGTQTVTITAQDQAGNDATDTFSVTYVPTLTIASNAALPSATQSVAYSTTLTRTGGTAPFTWDNNSGGSSLGGGACTGLTISTGGVVSGTPTTTGTCSFTSKVTDGASATDTQAHTIVVAVAGVGPHAWFDSLALRGDYVKSHSLRPLAGDLNPSSPYYAKQLNAANDGGLHAFDCVPALSDQKFSYDFAGDTDPNKVDAARAAIPAFAQPGACKGHPLTVAMLASTTGAEEKITLTDVTSTYDGRAMRIEDELLRMRKCTVTEGGDGAMYRIEATNQVCVIRGQYGTAAVSHALGVIPKLSVNQMSNYLRPTINSADGYTYLIVWDAYHTSSYLGVGTWDQGQKTYQLTNGSNTKMFEPKLRFDGRNGANVPVPGFNAATDVAAVSARSYNSLNTAGETTWSETNGNTMGVGVTAHTDIVPQAGNFIMKANVWTRWTIKVKQRANDFDLISMWIADENNDAVLIFDELPMSISGTLDPTKQTMREFWFAMGNSQSNYVRGDTRDLVIYYRNWAVLRWLHASEPADLAAEGLLQRPIR